MCRRIPVLGCSSIRSPIAPGVAGDPTSVLSGAAALRDIRRLALSHGCHIRGVLICGFVLRTVLRGRPRGVGDLDGHVERAAEVNRAEQKRNEHENSDQSRFHEARAAFATAGSPSSFSLQPASFACILFLRGLFPRYCTSTALPCLIGDPLGRLVVVPC